MVAGTRNGWVRGWSLSTFRPVTYGRMAGPVSAVAVSADGSTVAAATGRAARTWVRGRVAASRAAPQGTRFTAAGISPSGQVAAFAAFPDLDVLSTPDGSWRQAPLRGFGTWHRGRPPLITNLAVPSDTELVALDGRYGSWRRLALPGLTTAGSAVNTFGPSRYPAYTYALSPAGTLFTHSYVAAGSSLRVLSTRRPGPAGHARPGGRLALALAISRDGQWIASEDASGIHVSRVARGARPASAPRSYPGAEPLFSTSLAFAGPSDSRLISASGNQLTLWNLAQYSRIGRAARVPCPGGAAGSARGRGWRCGRAAGPPRSPTATGTCCCGRPWLVVRHGHHARQGRDRGVRAAAVEPDREPALRVRPHAVGRGNGRGGKGHPVMVRKNPDLPQDLALSPDGRRLFAVDAAGTVRIGPVPSGAAGPSGRDRGHGQPVSRPRAGPWSRGRPVSGRTPGCTSARRGQPGRDPGGGHRPGEPGGLHRGRPHDAAYLAGPRGAGLIGVAYSGPRLILQRENGDIDLRTMGGTRVIRTVQAGTPWNYGNIAVSPGPRGPGPAGRGTGRRPRHPRRPRIGAPAGRLPHPPRPRRTQQTTMAFTPGGRSLVTVTEGNSHSDDGVLTQLSLVPAEWVRVACTTSGHTLTPGDWRRYISSSPPAQLGCAR